MLGMWGLYTLTSKDSTDTAQTGSTGVATLPAPAEGEPGAQGGPSAQPGAAGSAARGTQDAKAGQDAAGQPAKEGQDVAGREAANKDGAAAGAAGAEGAAGVERAAKDIPVNVGQNNFDQVRSEFFRDDTVGREAFKADQLDWFNERSGKQWSTAYDFPAVAEKRVLKEKFTNSSSGRMQGYAFNLRRPLFTDIRVRRAFNLAYDWETSDRLLSNGDYHRDNSYFDGIPEFMATGLPEGAELQILEALRDKVPAELFTTPYKNPVGGNEEAARSNLREAARLLKEAGFENRDRKLVDPTGKPVSVEFLSGDPGDERGVLFYKPYLERLGMTVSIRTVDSVQYQNRIRNFDFDITTAVWGQSLSPGNEQRDFFGSDAADRPGSRNRPGIKNPAVDALIERIIFAKDRADLVASCKALDRVLLWNCYLVPQFAAGFERAARWDRFSRPDPLPKYGVTGFPSLWWYDADKAAKIKRS